MTADGWLPAVALLGDRDSMPGLALEGLLKEWGHDVSENLHTVDGWCSRTLLCVRMGEETSPQITWALGELRDMATYQRRMGIWRHRVVVVRLVPKSWRSRAVSGRDGPNPESAMEPVQFMARGWSGLLARSGGDEWLAAQRLDLLTRASMRADSECADILPAVWSADRGGARFGQLAESLDGTRWHGTDGLAAIVTWYLGE